MMAPKLVWPHVLNQDPLVWIQDNGIWFFLGLDFEAFRTIIYLNGFNGHVTIFHQTDFQRKLEHMMVLNLFHIDGDLTFAKCPIQI